jgi:hypothetical protein
VHTEYGLDENSGGGRQDEDSEESDGGEAGGLTAHVGAEAVAVFEEEEEREGEEGERGVVDYYWDTAPGLAMARNFNVHCLPQILEQIASCGALGPILLATERRQQATHTKAQDRGSRSSGKVRTASDDAVAAEPDDAVGDTAYLRKYAIYIVRQLTLDPMTLSEWPVGRGPSGAETHRSCCPECRGLGPTFLLP